MPTCGSFCGGSATWCEADTRGAEAGWGAQEFSCGDWWRQLCQPARRVARARRPDKLGAIMSVGDEVATPRGWAPCVRLEARYELREHLRHAFRVDRGGRCLPSRAAAQRAHAAWPPSPCGTLGELQRVCSLCLTTLRAMRVQLAIDGTEVSLGRNDALQHGASEGDVKYVSRRQVVLKAEGADAHPAARC